MAKKQHNWPRIILQWGTLAALVFFLTGLASKLFGSDPADPEALCPMGGLQALATFFVKGSLPCSMSSAQILMGIALAAAVILFSKLFCGYLCPVGTIEDLLTRIRKALGIRTEGPKEGSVFDAILRIVKYVLLFVVFYFSVSASELFCKKLDPYYATATAFKGEIVLWMASSGGCWALPAYSWPGGGSWVPCACWAGRWRFSNGIPACKCCMW